MLRNVSSGRVDERPSLLAVLNALREDDVFIVWKLDCLGRNMHHLVNAIHDLTICGIGFKVLIGYGTFINTIISSGNIFVALAEFESELISERTKAGLASARARGRKEGAPFKMTAAKLKLAMTAVYLISN